MALRESSHTAGWKNRGWETGFEEHWGWPHHSSPQLDDPWVCLWWKVILLGSPVTLALRLAHTQWVSVIPDPPEYTSDPYPCWIIYLTHLCLQELREIVVFPVQEAKNRHLLVAPCNYLENAFVSCFFGAIPQKNCPKLIRIDKNGSDYTQILIRICV